MNRRRMLAGAAGVALSARAGEARAQSEPAAFSALPAPLEALPESGAPAMAASWNGTGQLTAPVIIANTGPYPFIVDTGAERSVISAELARSLNLQTAGRSRLISLTGVQDAEKVHVRGVVFLPGPPHDLHALTLSEANIGAAGILGIDALRGQRVVFNFQTLSISVSEAPRRELRPEDGEIVVRARRRLGQLVLADSSADGVDVDVIIDSGSGVSIGNEALRRSLGLRNLSGLQRITLRSVTGDELPADYTRARSFVIGTARISELPIAFARADFFARMNLVRRPALLLGMDALRLFERVAVDFENRTAHFLLPRSER